MSGGVASGIFAIDSGAAEPQMVEVVEETEQVRAVGWELSPDGHLLTVVMSDGAVRTYDTASNTLTSNVPGLVGVTSDHSHHGQFYPKITSGFGRIYVADPAGSRVLELDRETLDVIREFNVTGKPAKLGLLGMVNRAAAEECNGHGHLDGSECHCDEGYRHDGADTNACVIDPAGICTLFGGTPVQHTVVTSFQDFPSAHADLYEPIEVELPANTASYIHFPVTHDDEHVIFVDNADAIDAVMHRDGTDVTGFHAAGANGQCSSDIPEHYHVDLEMDGDPPRVPYIIRFSDQFSQATTVTFMIVDK
jgi:hypothetical protein